MTDVIGDPSNSSLSVDSVTSDLSGTSVTCSDGNDILIASRDICVTGKSLIFCPTALSHSGYELLHLLSIICVPGRPKKDWFDRNNVVLLILPECGHALLHALICLCVP